MGYSAALFDIDGVLVGTHLLLAESYLFIAAEMSFSPPSPDRLRIALSLSPRQALDYLFGPGHRYLETGLRKFWRDNEPRYVFSFDGVANVITMARSNGFKVGAVTSRNHADAYSLLSLGGLTRLLDAVVVWGDYRRAKPAPDGIRVALSRLSAEPETAFYVGDQPEDMESAVAASVTAIGATWGSLYAAEDLGTAGAERVFSDVTGLLELVG